MLKLPFPMTLTYAYLCGRWTGLWPLSNARLSSAILFYLALDDAQALTRLEDSDSICDLYLSLGVGTVAMTMGEQGAMIATSEMRKCLAPYKINCLDATGAGDTFDGAFLARIAAGDDVFDAGEYANAAAALSTTGFGATGPIPRPDAVRALMSAQCY
jgi:2-dehydro-3-deoxygluconokinase